MLKFRFAQIMCIALGLLSHPVANGVQPFLGSASYHVPKNLFAYQFRTLYLDFLDNGNDTAITHSFLYGFTDKINSEITIPFLVKHKQGNSETSGFTDLMARTNIEVFSRIRPVEQDQLYVFLFEVTRFPTASTKTVPALSRGTYDFRVGAAIQYDTPHYGFFASSSCETSTTYKGFHPGNAFETTFVAGIQPMQPIMVEDIGSIPPIVLQLETNFLWLGQRSINGIKDPTSGAITIYTGPEFIYNMSHGSIMLAVEWPILRHNIKTGIRCGFFVNLYFY